MREASPRGEPRDTAGQAQAAWALRSQGLTPKPLPAFCFHKVKVSESCLGHPLGSKASTPGLCHQSARATRAGDMGSPLSGRDLSQHGQRMKQDPGATWQASVFPLLVVRNRPSYTFKCCPLRNRANFIPLIYSCWLPCLYGDSPGLGPPLSSWENPCKHVFSHPPRSTTAQNAAEISGESSGKEAQDAAGLQQGQLLPDSLG